MASSNRSDYMLAVRKELMVNGRPDFQKVVDQGTPVFHLAKAWGPEYTATILSIMLTKFVSSFNVSKNMTPEQRHEYALTLVLESPQIGDGVPAMRLEDFAIFFEQAKTGKWGKPFDYIDGALIEEWLEKYWKERLTKYREEKRVAEEKRLEAERPTRDKQTGAIIPYVDPTRIVDAVAEMTGATRGEDGRLATPEAQEELNFQKLKEEYHNLRNPQEEAKKSQARASMISEYCNYLVAGKLVMTPENRQFYDNHKSDIEAELKKRLQSNSQ